MSNPSFEAASDKYWGRVRFLKCIEPWRDANFRWTDLLYRESETSPRSTPPPALAILRRME